MQAVAFLLCAVAISSLYCFRPYLPYCCIRKHSSSRMEAIQPYQSQSKISCLLFVAVQRYALHDYSGLIKVRSVPSSVAALMIIGGTLCTELQTRYKNSSGVWLLSVVFHIL